LRNTTEKRIERINIVIQKKMFRRLLGLLTSLPNWLENIYAHCSIWLKISIRKTRNPLGIHQESTRNLLERPGIYQEGQGSIRKIRNLSGRPGIIRKTTRKTRNLLGRLRIQ